MKKIIIVLIIIGLAIYFMGGSGEEANVSETQNTGEVDQEASVVVEQEIEDLETASVSLDAELDDLEDLDF